MSKDNNIFVENSYSENINEIIINNIINIDLRVQFLLIILF